MTEPEWNVSITEIAQLRIQSCKIAKIRSESEVAEVQSPVQVESVINSKTSAQQVLRKLSNILLHF